MTDHLFWLTDDQFARLEPYLPTDTRGKARVEISGIVHVLKSGCRRGDAPSLYGPQKTLDNRIVRWANKGIWQNIFQALASAGGPPAQVLIDSSAATASIASPPTPSSTPSPRPTSCMATRAMTAMPSGQRSRAWERHPTFRPRSIGVGRTAFRPPSIGTATPSSTSFAASRSSAGLRPDMTAAPSTSWRRSASPPPSATGDES